MVEKNEDVGFLSTRYGKEMEYKVYKSHEMNNATWRNRESGDDGCSDETEYNSVHCPEKASEESKALYMPSAALPHAVDLVLECEHTPRNLDKEVKMKQEQYAVLDTMATWSKGSMVERTESKNDSILGGSSSPQDVEYKHNKLRVVEEVMTMRSQRMKQQAKDAIENERKEKYAKEKLVMVSQVLSIRSQRFRHRSGVNAEPSPLLFPPEPAPHELDLLTKHPVDNSAGDTLDTITIAKSTYVEEADAELGTHEKIPSDVSIEQRLNPPPTTTAVDISAISPDVDSARKTLGSSGAPLGSGGGDDPSTLPLISYPNRPLNSSRTEDILKQELVATVLLESLSVTVQFRDIDSAHRMLQSVAHILVTDPPDGESVLYVAAHPAPVLDALATFKEDSRVVDVSMDILFFLQKIVSRDRHLLAHRTFFTTMGHLVLIHSHNTKLCKRFCKLLVEVVGTGEGYVGGEVRRSGLGVLINKTLNQPTPSPIAVGAEHALLMLLVHFMAFVPQMRNMLLSAGIESTLQRYENTCDNEVVLKALRITIKHIDHIVKEVVIVDPRV